jgi:thioredoxin-dependent peroxiredoxin
MPNINDIAPDFTLNNQEGTPVSLKDYKGKKVVLYFYPKDQTPGCIKEACSFRDNMETFQNKNTIVLGVSIDSEKSHQNFINKQSLNFTLLSDPEKVLAQAYGVWGEKKMYGRTYMGIFRKTFLIDEKGIITKIYDKVNVTNHAIDIINDWSL